MLGQFIDSAKSWLGLFTDSAGKTWLISANSENLVCQIQEKLGCCFVEQKRKVVQVSHHSKLTPILQVIGNFMDN